MKIIEKISDYLYENEIEIHIYKNKINIVNYMAITDFSSSKIIVKHNNGIVKISGSNLVVSQLLNDEVLISGKILQIELG